MNMTDAVTFAEQIASNIAEARALQDAIASRWATLPALPACTEPPEPIDGA